MTKRNDPDQLLFKAVERHDVQRAREALKRGANPNARRGNQTPLEIAVAKMALNEPLVLALADAGADLTPLKDHLLWATYTGRARLVKALAEIGANAHIGEPLLIALGWRSADMVQSLIAAGADPNANDSQDSPLLKAIKTNQTESACMLLRAGADPARKNPRDEIAIAEAAARGNSKVLDALIAAGADVNQTSLAAIGGKSGPDAFAKLLKTLVKQKFAGLSVIGTKRLPQFHVTPLILAVAFGHADAVRMLLDAGADVNAKDGNGVTPLEWAARQKNAKIIKLLRDAGAAKRIDAPEERLLVAAEQGNAIAVKRLLAEGAQIDARDRRDKTAGRTALMLAAANGHIKTVELLLKSGADLRMTDDPQGAPARGLRAMLSEGGLSALSEYRLGRTALMLAAETGHETIVDSLLRAGAEVDAFDYARCTPLYVAAASGRAKGARRLIAGGANVNFRGPQRTTPLLAAVEAGSIEVVKALLDARAKVVVKDSDGESPLISAALSGRPDILRLLLAVPADERIPQAMLDEALQFGASADCGKRLRSGRRQKADEDVVLEIVDQLLSAGANPKARGDLGPALGGAALRGYAKVAVRLIEAGANVNTREDGFPRVAVLVVEKRARRKSEKATP